MLASIDVTLRDQNSLLWLLAHISYCLRLYHLLILGHNYGLRLRLRLWFFCQLLLFDLLLVSFQVAEKVELGKETALAVLTSKPFLALVDFQVFVKVRLLSESVAAIWE